MAIKERKISLVAKQIQLKDTNQETDDWAYWLSRTPQERLAAVTMLIRQNMVVGQRMDRTIFNQRKMK